MKSEQKFKLLMLQTRYLKAQLAADKETHSIAMIEFAKEFNRNLATLPEEQKNVLKSAADNNTNKSRPSSKKKDENQPLPKRSPEGFKKTFLEIAKKAHPDKLLDLPEEEKTFKEKLFRKAQAAAEEQDLMELLDVAERLGVDLPEPDLEQIDLLKKSIQKIRSKIKKIKTTASWEWHHSNEKDKKTLMAKYISFMFQSLKK